MSAGPVTVTTYRVGRRGQVMRPYARPVGKLTKRHVQIITLISHGQTNKSIGEQIGLSERVIKAEITHACGVLHAKNRAHLAATAIRRGLIA